MLSGCLRVELGLFLYSSISLKDWVHLVCLTMYVRDSSSTCLITRCAEWFPYSLVTSFYRLSLLFCKVIVFTDFYFCIHKRLQVWKSPCVSMGTSASMELSPSLLDFALCDDFKFHCSSSSLLVKNWLSLEISKRGNCFVAAYLLWVRSIPLLFSFDF